MIFVGLFYGWHVVAFEFPSGRWMARVVRDGVTFEGHVRDRVEDAIADGPTLAEAAELVSA